MRINDNKWQEFESFLRGLTLEQLKITSEGIDLFVKAIADRGRIKGHTQHCVFEAEVELIENI